MLSCRGKNKIVAYHWLTLLLIWMCPTKLKFMIGRCAAAKYLFLHSLLYHAEHSMYKMYIVYCICIQRTKVFRRHQFVCVWVCFYFFCCWKKKCVRFVVPEWSIKGGSKLIYAKTALSLLIFFSPWSLLPVFKCMYTTTTQFTDCFSLKKEEKKPILEIQCDT